MANVSVYNMEGKEVGTVEINVREHRRLKHVPKFPAAEENRGDRKEPAMQDRDPQEHRSGQAAA